MAISMTLILKKDLKPSTEFHDKTPMTLRKPVVVDPLSTSDEFIVKMIEEGLDALGENVARVIVHNVETRYSLKRNQIAKKPDLFVKALRDIFGEGSLTIERIIVGTMRRKTGIPINGKENCNLSDTVAYIRERLSYVPSQSQRIL